MRFCFLFIPVNIAILHWTLYNHGETVMINPTVESTPPKGSINVKSQENLTPGLTIILQAITSIELPETTKLNLISFASAFLKPSLLRYLRLFSITKTKPTFALVQFEWV